VANLILDMEERNASWHLSLIKVHSMTSKLLPFTGADYTTLEALHLKTVTRLLKTHLIGEIGKTTSIELRDNLAGYPHLYAKLDYQARQHRRKHFPTSSPVRKECSLTGQINQHSFILYTSQQAGVDLSEIPTFHDEHKLVSNQELTSKTKKTIFLNSK
jgi:hypothetical protein